MQTRCQAAKPAISGVILLRYGLLLLERTRKPQGRAAAHPLPFSPRSQFCLIRALDPGRPRRGPRESRSRGRGVVASGKLQELFL
jgi:hypothetical protein